MTDSLRRTAHENSRKSSGVAHDYELDFLRKARPAGNDIAESPYDPENHALRDEIMLGWKELQTATEFVTNFTVRTPVLESPALNARLGFRLLVKPECLQHTGSFKLRGAYHTIAQLPERLRSDGLMAFSSGNHAAAVAYVAHHFAVPATIIMPCSAPSIKRANTECWGARVVLYDPASEQREEVAQRQRKTTSGVLIKPFDDERIILGQGTAMFEALADCNAAHRLPRRIFVPCSGGGLLAGSALAAAQYGVAVTACEPLGFASTAAALSAGKVTPAYTEFPKQSQICDALLSPVVGETCFPLINAHVDCAESVSESEVLQAMAVAFRDLKLVVEPGGAASLAVAMRQQGLDADDILLALLSGGNVDSATFQKALASSARPSA